MNYFLQAIDTHTRFYYSYSMPIFNKNINCNQNHHLGFKHSKNMSRIYTEPSGAELFLHEKLQGLNYNMFYQKNQRKKNRLVDFSTRRLTHTHAL